MVVIIYLKLPSERRTPSSRVSWVNISLQNPRWQLPASELTSRTFLIRNLSSSRALNKRSWSPGSKVGSEEAAFLSAELWLLCCASLAFSDSDRTKGLAPNFRIKVFYASKQNVHCRPILYLSSACYIIKRLVTSVGGTVHEVHRIFFFFSKCWCDDEGWSVLRMRFLDNFMMKFCGAPLARYSIRSLNPVLR